MFTGLIGVLVLLAAISLIVKGAYPRNLFDYEIGLNRWVVRVVAYGALMTTAYPPLLLDKGEHEPRHETVSQSQSQTSEARGARAGRSTREQ